MDGLARIALFQKRIDDAITWLEKIGSLDRDAVGPQIRLVGLYLDQRRHDSAINLARRIEARFPRYPAAIEALGRVHMAAGKIPSALREFRRIVELVAKSAEGLRRVSLLLAKADDIDGARSSLEKAIALDPDYLPARTTLIELEAGENNFEMALSLATELRRAHPQSAAVDILAGDLFMRTEQFAAAADAFEAGFKKLKTFTVVKRLYHARRKSGGGAAALTLLKEWVSAHPWNQAARRLLASAYLYDGNLAAAIAQNERLLENLPDDAAILNNLAGLYLKMRDPRALDYGKKAYLLAPEQPAALDTYGWVLVQNGDPARGLVLLRQAHARAVKNPEVRYHLAVALDRLGRSAEARRELKKALRTGGDFDGAADARALLRRLSGK